MYILDMCHGNYMDMNNYCECLLFADSQMHSVSMFTERRPQTTRSIHTIDSLIFIMLLLTARISNMCGMYD